MRLHRCLSKILCASVLLCIPVGAAEAVRKPKPWDVCVVVEGKVDECGAGGQAKPFIDFLDPGLWQKEPRDAFDGELKWDLEQAGGRELKTDWRELGLLGTVGVRAVRYLIGDQPQAEVIIAERSPGLFAPLMKWSGNMPRADIHQEGRGAVLVMAKNWGGNRPSMEYWVWLREVQGPIRLDVNASVRQGISKVAPQFYSAGDISFDWQAFRCQTTVGRDLNGKVAEAGQVKIWFALGPSGLVVKQAEFEEDFGNNPRTTKWP